MASSPMLAATVAPSAGHFALSCGRHWLESTRRTLEAMVKDGLLEKYRSREARSIVLGGETTATVVSYGLPDTVSVVRDTDGAGGAIEGEFARVF